MATASIRRQVGNVAVLYTSAANIDGPQTQTLELPSGFGDCEVLESMIYINAIATLLTGPTEAGPYFDLFYTGSGPIQPFGASKWLNLQPTTLIAWTKRDALDVRALMQEGMSFRAVFGEVDTNAAPTADYELFLTVLRLREPETSMPPRLAFTS